MLAGLLGEQPVQMTHMHSGCAGDVLRGYVEDVVVAHKLYRGAHMAIAQRRTVAGAHAGAGGAYKQRAERAAYEQIALRAFVFAIHLQKRAHAQHMSLLVVKHEAARLELTELAVVGICRIYRFWRQHAGARGTQAHGYLRKAQVAGARYRARGYAAQQQHLVACYCDFSVVELQLTAALSGYDKAKLSGRAAYLVCAAGLCQFQRARRHQPAVHNTASALLN